MKLRKDETKIGLFDPVYVVLIKKPDLWSEESDLSEVGLFDLLLLLYL